MLMAVPNMNADRELLEGALMRLVVGLELEKHPKEQLDLWSQDIETSPFA